MVNNLKPLLYKLTPFLFTIFLSKTAWEDYKTNYFSLADLVIMTILTGFYNGWSWSWTMALATIPWIFQSFISWGDGFLLINCLVFLEFFYLKVMFFQWLGFLSIIFSMGSRRLWIPLVPMIWSSFVGVYGLYLIINQWHCLWNYFH